MRLPALVLTASAFATSLPAASSADVELPPVLVQSDRVANQGAVASYASPVTVLRYEPTIDVQGRSFAEAQSDIAIRGGTFENTGIKIGSLALIDPQTGHYTAEIPVPSPMLGAPTVLTGFALASQASQGTSGVVALGWRPIADGGFVAVGAGEDDAFRVEGYAARSLATAGGRVGVDLSTAYSSSDGPVANGDHRFRRHAARLQRVSDAAQTDVFAGWQHKQFGWPNLYTPFNSPESEDIETTLVAANHRQVLGHDGGYLGAGVYYRENYDDYRFNRFAPVGAVLPFEHTTWVYGATLDGRWVAGAGSPWAANFRAGIISDELKSTSLIFGRFRTRTQTSAALFPEWQGGPDASGGRWTVSAGAAFDDSNREASAVSPGFSVTRERGRGVLRRWSFAYAESTQVASYTALNASTTAGLFRGNPDLGRADSRNLELAGFFGGAAGWDGQAALFFRQDDGLVDWTFRRGVTARTANAVDTETTGVELQARRSWDRVDLVLGYAWLDKRFDYRGAAVDASFYALNFARHRATAAVIVKLGAGLELRVDNEVRFQEANLLRVQGGDDTVLTEVGLTWVVPTVRGLRVSVQVENLWDSDFQEVPAVPASPRRWSAGASWAW